MAEDSFGTLAVHAGAEPDEFTSAVHRPSARPARSPRMAWAGRTAVGSGAHGDPKRARLEEAVAAVEWGRHRMTLASRAAATAMVAELVGLGDGVIVGDVVHGGTYRLFEHVLRGHGVSPRSRPHLCRPHGQRYQGIRVAA